MKFINKSKQLFIKLFTKINLKKEIDLVNFVDIKECIELSNKKNKKSLFEYIQEEKAIKEFELKKAYRHKFS